MRLSVLILAATMCVQAQPRPERVAWNRTSEVLKGKFVQITLTSGTRISGDWVSVTPSTVTINIEKTSNNHERPKGLQVVVRSSIAGVKARIRRVRGRVIGTLTGFYSIAALGAFVSGSIEALQGPTGIAAFMGGLTGYFIARSCDRASREIVLMKDSGPATNVSLCTFRSVGQRPIPTPLGSYASGAPSETNFGSGGQP
jgi:hypothetical protein